MREFRGVTIPMLDEDDLVSPLSSQENFRRSETDGPVDNGVVYDRSGSPNLLQAVRTV
jgi:hypothetical protein